MIIGFLAKKRHGKDTVCDYIVKKYGYKKVSFAYPLKQGVKHLFGFTNEQINGNEKEMDDIYWGVKPRKVMQFIGTDIARNQFPRKLLGEGIGQDFWIKRFDKWYKEICTEKIVISDVRFQNEVDYIHSIGGIVVKIKRLNNELDDKDEHESESQIDNIKNYDHLVLNDSTLEKLYINIDKQMNELI